MCGKKKKRAGPFMISTLHFSDSYSLHFYLTYRLLSTMFLLIFKIKIHKMKKVLISVMFVTAI